MKQASQFFVRPETLASWPADSVSFYGAKLFHNLYFFLNANRYESLKSTGKLEVIDDDTLRNRIIDQALLLHAENEEFAVAVRRPG